MSELFLIELYHTILTHHHHHRQPIEVNTSLPPLFMECHDADLDFLRPLKNVVGSLRGGFPILRCLVRGHD